MANGFTFVSPGVKFRETDLALTTQSVGVTNAGLVGETQKGAAFELIKIKDQADFIRRFGYQSTEKMGNDLKYLLPYYANEYLTQSSQLYVTRILGISGYDAGKGWAITLQGDVDTTTKTSFGTENLLAAPIITTGDTTYFSGTTFGLFPIPDDAQIGVQLSGVTTTTFSGGIYTNTEINYIVSSSTVDFSAVTYNYTPLAEYDKMVVAVIRSRADYSGSALNDKVFRATTLTLSGESANDVMGQFTLTATNVNSTEQYKVSLNPENQDFIPRVIGDKPKGKNTKLYVEAIYPDLIKKLSENDFCYKVNTQLTTLSASNFINYQQQYQTPETPYVVGELRGSKIDRLFKFVSISDGNSANKEIKISIQNIDISLGEFDIIIRDFNDTDASPNVLESFARCSMIESTNNFVGKRIGTVDTKYNLQSSYIMIEMADDFPMDTVPAGFEGYNFRTYTSGGTGSIAATPPKMFYKTSYEVTDKVRKTYLGVSEKGYDTVASNGVGINQNMFNYIGLTSTNIVKSKGFHLDITATNTYNGIDYEVGIDEFSNAAVANPLSLYNNKNSRKFTLVPAGGFDGWDEHREIRTNKDIYKVGNFYGFASSDYYAYLEGIRTFSDAEQVYVNLLATPGLNWSDHLSLTNEATEMVEEERGDCLYIMDSPDLHRDDASYTMEDVTDLFDSTNLDSSFTTTYYPYIQIADTQNGTNVYIPPTGAVLKAMAFTDNVSFSWFAPAGVNRGGINAIKTRVKKLDAGKRDVLYAGRINPILDSQDLGLNIWGQKTTQRKQTSLDRINVRRLLLTLRKQIAIICSRLLFEPNDDTVREEFLVKVNPLLANIRANRGLTDFRIILDSPATSPEAIDRREMNGKIYIKPTSALEFISVDFIATSQGVNFQNI